MPGSHANPPSLGRAVTPSSLWLGGLHTASRGCPPSCVGRPLPVPAFRVIISVTVGVARSQSWPAKPPTGQDKNRSTLGCRTPRDRHPPPSLPRLAYSSPATRYRVHLLPAGRADRSAPAATAKGPGFARSSSMPPRRSGCGAPPTGGPLATGRSALSVPPAPVSPYGLSRPRPHPLPRHPLAPARPAACCRLRLLTASGGPRGGPARPPVPFGTPCARHRGSCPPAPGAWLAGQSVPVPTSAVGPRAS